MYVKLHKEIPVLSIKNFFVLNHYKKSQLIDDIFKSKYIHDTKQNSPGISSNFPILEDKLSTLSKLYDKTIITSKKIFKNLNISQNNSRQCWSLCTNKDYWKSVPHDHVQTSTINFVYYLNVPKINSEYCGRILFFKNFWYGYQPEPYELLIMPNYLTHDTEYHQTSEWRISINMELLCSNHFEWNI